MPRLNAAQPIVASNGTMEQPFRFFMNEVSNALPILGDGSPEGVVDAPLYSLYIDRLGTAGNIQYRKMAAEIGGDTKKGWLLV